MLNFSSSTSIIVESVLFTLIAGSVITWTLILAKSIQVWLIRKQNVKFRAAFWSAPDFKSAANLEDHHGPAYRVATVGFSALKDIDSNSANDLQHFGDRQEVL